MNEIKKNFNIRTMRCIIQVLAFIFFPELFITVFSAFGSIYTALPAGDFSLTTLTEPLLILLAVIPITMLWGRFFCGFLCAFGSMGDFFWTISHKLLKTRLSINENVDSLLKLIKYVVLILIIGLFWTLSIKIDSTMNPWTIFGMFASVSGWTSVSYMMTVGAALLFLIIVGSAFIERFFCRYLCPLGAIFTLISRFRVFRIKKPRHNCASCRLCTKNCAMGIALYKQDLVTSGECIDCFKCLEACPRNNIYTNPAPAVAAAISVAVIAGLYYAGNLATQSIDTIGSSEITSGSSALQGKYTNGVYTASASGFRGLTTVQVTVENGSISDITVLSTRDDTKYFNRAKNTVISNIINTQSVNVDTVTGATFSSNGIINAVADALDI